MARRQVLTGQQRVFAEVYANTRDATYAATKAGYPSPQPRGSQNLASPHVQAEINRRVSAKLREGRELAVDWLLSALRDPKVAPRDKNGASKVILAEARASVGAGGELEPHEMTSEQIQAAITLLEGEAASRAKDVTPPPPAEASIFA